MVIPIGPFLPYYAVTFAKERFQFAVGVPIPFVYFRDVCKQPLNVEADRGRPAGLGAECNTT